MERLARAQPQAVLKHEPFALVQAQAHGVRIVAVNGAAYDGGVLAGQPLADARAVLPSLRSRPWDEACDYEALVALARWCGRYGPQRHVAGRDGVWVDITGVAHLFGGEEALLRDVVAKLAWFGVTACAAIAETYGAACALARCLPVQAGAFRGAVFGASRRASETSSVLRASPCAHVPAFFVSAPGTLRSALKDLPVSALRLTGPSVVVLRRLGLFRIGQLYGLPREGLARRFREAPSSRTSLKRQVRKGVSQRHAQAAAGDVLKRLDQALGLMSEPLPGLAQPPVLRSQQAWSDPLLTSEGIAAEAGQLVTDVVRQLVDMSLGARRVVLSVYRSDGTMTEVRAGFSAPCRDAGHIMGLLQERLAGVDVGFGVDALALEVCEADLQTGEQRGFAVGSRHSVGVAPTGVGLARLVDKLSNRLGADAVTQLQPVESHIPEQAQRHVAYNPAVFAQLSSAGFGDDHPSDTWVRPAHVKLSRPCFLLPAPEPIQVLAQVPEGAPRRFKWRRVVHNAAHALGPERMAPAWWQTVCGALENGASGGPLGLSRTRDYYRVTVIGGASYWIFREGLFDTEDAVGDEGRPRWFLHGLYG